MFSENIANIYFNKCKFYKNYVQESKKSNISKGGVYYSNNFIKISNFSFDSSIIIKNKAEIGGISYNNFGLKEMKFLNTKISNNTAKYFGKNFASKIIQLNLLKILKFIIKKLVFQIL